MLKLREREGIVGNQKGNQRGIRMSAKIQGELWYILVVLVMKMGMTALLPRQRLDM